MDLEDVKHEIRVYNGNKYELIALGEVIDLSDQNNDKKTQITHLLKGFEEDLYLIIEEDTFYFGYKVGETGLVVNVEDEEIYDLAVSILLEVLN